ncbi:MAG TPA: bacteriohemerythrin [Bryobacteraceae bacterium]|nr:bacteriohemerythrin [Bryobacteraceae bacterium]
MKARDVRCLPDSSRRGVVWSAEHATGNSEIDEQHARILELVNAAHAAASTGAGASTIDLVLALLTRYLQRHFVAEEQLMRSVAYPGLTEHAEHHAWCLQELQRRLDDYHEGRSDLDSLLNLVCDWLDQHTLSRDKELAVFLRHRATATETAAARA